MTLFIALCLAVVAPATAAVLVPWLSRARDERRGGRAEASSASVLAEQLAELDAELAAGRITQAQSEATRAEIERRVLEEGPVETAPAPARGSRALPVALGAAIPAAAVALYVLLGAPHALVAQQGGGQSPPVTREQVESIVTRLAAHMETDPGNAEGWSLLGRSYVALERYPEAVHAYARAASLVPGNAQVLADYADALAMAHGRNLSGEPAKLIARALEADPENVKALALAGSLAFEQGDFPGAAARWRKSLQLVPAESDIAQSLRDNIAQAESAALPGRGAGAAAPAQDHGGEARRAAPRDAAQAQAAVYGRVSLDPSLAAAARPEDPVYVFARAAEGPRAPLAVIRRQVKDLPFDFALDDSMAMTPALKISAFPRVVVVARVSRSGIASPQKGDLEATAGPLAPGAERIALRIASVRE